MVWISKAAKWLWDSLGNLITLGTLLMGFAIPAWAVHTARIFVAYSPVSWVLAGFLGMLAVALAYLLLGMGRTRWVRAAYNRRMLARGGGAVDPMGKSFEGKRIFLNEFVLPSNVHVQGKIFIDCEIIGPANVFLMAGNNVKDGKSPKCDAVVLAAGRDFFNGYIFNDCTFRGCSLQRITLFVTEAEYPLVKDLNWLNWITPPPAQTQIPFNP